MAPLPKLTQSLALRVGQSETDHMVSWLAAIGRVDGNPYSAEARRFRGATALAGNDLGPLFNRVLGFGDAEADHLDEATAWYAARGQACRIDVNPHAVGIATMRRLCSAGFCPFRHHDHLYGLPVAEGGARPSAVVVREAGENDRPTWARVWGAAFLGVTGVEDEVRQRVAAATASLVGDPDWTLFFAFCDGSPAAAAALYVQDGIGSLVLAGTLPEFQGRGCQTALLRARIEKAGALGCDLVAAQAALDAPSHHNMERAGLRVAYTRAFWLRPLS